ncbi:ParB/RepB/Spo0J family partition protein [Streptomyces sp. NPDC021093]|uniref:ParB/RepB/Spo0J family partition protein n=1 Tax=Streptomyces sp. NPDC021093 TaxID=3365112 RepID=UPI0037A17AF5
MSSKASRLGTSASFGNARPVSARRAAINSATKAPTEGAPPPVVLPLRHISLNPANPRATLGDLTALAGSLKDHGQKQAITIMARDAYLVANPDQSENLEADTSYVVIDGNSRLAAAREAGLPTLKVMVDDDLGSDPDELLESALVANIHRQDLAPLDEARALEALLRVHGSQRKLAARLHRSQGWVAQRLALLGLTPELQQRLERKEESVELLRAVGNKPAEEQQAEFERLKQLKAEEEADRERQRAARSVPESDYGVITPAPGSASVLPSGPGSGPSSGLSSGSSSSGQSSGSTPVPGSWGASEPLVAPVSESEGDYGVITSAFAPRSVPAPDPQSDYGVITSEAPGLRWHESDSPASARTESQRRDAVPDRAFSDRTVPGRTVPDRAASDRAVSDRAASDRAGADAVPWADPKAVLAIAKQWMTPENYRTLLKLAADEDTA